MNEEHKGPQFHPQQQMSDEDEDDDERNVNDSIISSENFAAGEEEFDDDDGEEVDVDNMDDDMEDQEQEGDEDDEDDEDEDEEGLETQDSVQNLVPIEFAKAHIARIEDDMKHMHERHVKLMREMDSNYKMIEKETQEYYVEFLQKWREVAKSKITHYRRQSEQLIYDKETLSKEKMSIETELENARQQVDTLMREKCQLMQDHNEDLDRREAEIESMRIVDQKKENEKGALKQRLEEARKENTQLQKENGT